MRRLLGRIKRKLQRSDSPAIRKGQICLFTKLPVLHRNLTPASLEEAIYHVKLRLQVLGYLSPTSSRADHIYDEATETAVHEFQKDHHLTVDGIVGPLTHACLFYPMLHRQLNNPSLEVEQAIRMLQTILKDEGFLNQEINGKFGWPTERAVRAFQQRYSLKADGVVGAVTWAVLLGMRQRKKAFPSVFLLTPNYLPLFEQLLKVAVTAVGIYLSPLANTEALTFSTTVATAYALPCVVSPLLDRLPLQLPTDSQQWFWKYSPYMLIGLCWEVVLSLFSSLIELMPP